MHDVRRLLLLLIAGTAAACASSTPAAKPVAAPVAALPAAAPAAPFDSKDFQKDLEDAYAQILSRDGVPPSDVQIVDIESAASIPIPEHRTITSAVRLFSVDMKTSIQASLLRSARYRKLIDKALEEQQLPKGLAYLPVIESAYDPTLTSRAGAHGIWQFMPDTAREYGLRVDWWVDDRADPERATRAAARYLRDLYKQFNDWPLALAAYNCGPGRVRRKLQETGAKTFWELLEQSALPKETRGYVPTFYATLIIATDPGTYGFKLREPVDLQESAVELEGPLSLRYLAEVAGVNVDVLEELNPSFRRGIVPPGRSLVRVPRKAASTIASRADSLRNEDPQVAVCTFTLRDGDSIERLADAIGTKPDTLLAMNGLSSAKKVGRGDSLYLPVHARDLGALLARSASEQYFYAVAKGDTLYSVARRNGLTVDELRDLNDLGKDEKLRPGQKLRVNRRAGLAAGGM